MDTSPGFRLTEEKETDYNRTAEICTEIGTCFLRKLKPMKCNNSDGSWGLISKAVGHLPNFNNVSVPKIRNTVNYLLKSNLSFF